MNLRRKAEQVSNRIFLGGPPGRFESVGRLQLIALLEAGLCPDSKVLDIGCGCLRGGYWLIRFLDPACYCGIEPHHEMVQIGLEEFFDSTLLEFKQPKFDFNSTFDVLPFNVVFDFFMARSIWTHASKQHIQKMLDQFVKHSNKRAAFLTSYHRAETDDDDYFGDAWVGRSHESDKRGQVAHRFEWIEHECASRGLRVRELRQKRLNIGKQIWLKVTKK